MQFDKWYQRFTNGQHSSSMNKSYIGNLLIKKRIHIPQLLSSPDFALFWAASNFTSDTSFLNVNHIDIDNFWWLTFCNPQPSPQVIKHLFEPYLNWRVAQAFQIWTTFHINWWWSYWDLFGDIHDNSCFLFLNFLKYLDSKNNFIFIFIV